MIRLAVLGNCQVYGFRHALTELLPGSTVDAYAVGDAKVIQNAADIAVQLSAYDAVFTQKLDAANLGPLRTSELQHISSLILYPAFSFTGFQPDQLYFYGPGGKLPLNSFGQTQSALITACFANGIAEERVEALFNTFIFEKLGYFAEYNKAREFLVRMSAAAGYDLERYFQEWQAEGSFMHTVNHPSIRVIATLARDAAAKAGLVKADTPVPKIRYDALQTVERWPVYPPLAKRLSINGEFRFSIRPAIAKPERKTMSLREFIAECYALYAPFPKAVFDQSSIRRARNVLAAEVI
jgi:hypothetical protein